jgi:hypothetical protein
MNTAMHRVTRPVGFGSSARPLIDAETSRNCAEARGATLRRALALLVLMPLTALAAAPDRHYRVAGIVAGYPGAAIAVIELPDGRQRSYREGDLLDEGTIREITPGSVRIEFPEDDLILRLRGSPQLAANRSAGAAANTEQGAAEEVGSEEASAEEAMRNQQLGSNDVARLLAAAERTRHASDAETASEIVAAHLNDILEIPAEAVVVAVDEVPVASPAAALDALAAQLGEGATASVTVSGAEDLRTIVVAPDPEQ